MFAANVAGEVDQVIAELVKPVPVGAVVTGVLPVTGVVIPETAGDGFAAVAGKRIVKVLAPDV